MSASLPLMPLAVMWLRRWARWWAVWQGWLVAGCLAAMVFVMIYWAAWLFGVPWLLALLADWSRFPLGRDAYQWLQQLGAFGVSLGCAGFAARAVLVRIRREPGANGPDVLDRRAGPLPRPRQLPRDVTAFSGRADELEKLLASASHSRMGSTESVKSAVVICAIDGMGGIGKTALAVHAGHRLAEQFPDGQLFIDLHGFTAGVAQVSPGEALDRLLRDVGVPADRIPADVDGRAALWRSALAGRRMLIVLDNAATEAQVRPLLPGVAGCQVLVTSRRRLPALEAASVLSLETLPQADAVALLVRTVGRPDLTTQTPGVLEAVRLCGRLPLAIRIAAARLRHRPMWTIADLLRYLGDVKASLATLDDGQRSVHATLHLSYQYLPVDAQRTYRLLGLHPGPDIEPYAAAALTSRTQDQAHRLLDALVDNHLLAEPSAGRYRFHDLVRAHAAGTAVQEETQTRQRAALGRLLDHYRHTAATAVHTAYPYQRQHRPAVGTASTPAPELIDGNSAQRWLDTELANLIAATHHAADHGWPEHAWQLSTILDGHLHIRGRYREAQTLHQHALDLARRLGDRSAELYALTGLGSVHWMLGGEKLAEDHSRQALRIARDIGDRAGELRALQVLGHIQRMLGHKVQAGDHYRQVLRIAREIGDRSGQLSALHVLGHIASALDHHDQAADCYRQSLQTAREANDRISETQVLNCLGDLHRLLGQHEHARDCYQQALRIASGIGDGVGELNMLNAIGDLHRKLGHHHQAVDYYERLLALARELNSGNWQFEALQGLGRLYDAAGQPDLALSHHNQALQLAIDLNHRTDQARAHDGVARALHTLKQHDNARHHWHSALRIFTGLGIEQSEDVEASVRSLRANLRGIGDPGHPQAPPTASD